ncbi:hypothetical protein NUSPORA_00763 [Nucleospora cyclopteri]
MEDPQTIIKELRVDWDTVLTDDFNPLHLALAVNNGSIPATEFRDMYHKLENCMEKIISTNFKGFSDSLLSYNMFFAQNTKLLKTLEECEEIVTYKETDFNAKSIGIEHSQSDFYMKKYEICKKLLEIKITFEEYQSTRDLLKRCYQLVKCLDLIDKKEYVKIKGIFEYRKLIYKEYLELTDEINNELFAFVFRNEINNSFKCLLILGSLYELEQFVKENFRSHTFNEIEFLIIKMYKERVNLEKLCKQIMFKIDNIIRNYETVIDLVLNNFKLKKTEEDFFGNQNEQYGYVTKIDKPLNIIKSELGKFISKYSISTEYDNNFSLDNIIDNIDYNKIYEPQYNIFTVVSDNKDQSELKKLKNNKKTQYTLITTPKIEVTTFLLQHTTNTVLRIFLNQKVETEYTKFKLEKSKKKIDFAFESEIKIDPLDKNLTLEHDIFKIIKNNKKDSKNSSYDNQILKYLNSKIVKKFNTLFKELFTSEIVIQPTKMITIYDGYHGGFTKEPDQEFQKAVTTKYINKNDLLLTKQNYYKAVYALNTLKNLDVLVSSRETGKMYQKYFDAIRKQVNLEFFYYFDLFYREGNYSSNFYLKKIVSVFELIYNESKNALLFDGLYDNLIFYCKINVAVFAGKSNDDLRLFVKQLKIFDEIMGEIEFYSNLESLYKFYEDVIAEKSTEEAGKTLQAKIRARGKPSRNAI